MRYFVFFYCFLASLFARSILSEYAISDDVLFGIKWTNKIVTEKTGIKPSNTEQSNDPSKSHSTTKVKATSFGGAPQNQNSNSAEDVFTIRSTENEMFKCRAPLKPRSRYEKHNSSKYAGLSEFELLSELHGGGGESGSGCWYKIESYWTYEICHWRYIRQFHEEPLQTSAASKDEKPRTTMQEYYLGKTDFETVKNSYLPAATLSSTERERADVKRQQNGEKSGADQNKAARNSDHNTENKESAENNAKQEQETVEKKLPTVTISGVEYPYFPVVMSGGTPCDLSGKPRNTTVKYLCHPENGGAGGLIAGGGSLRGELNQVNEVSTCNYEIIVYTNQLCEHPAYKLAKQTLNQIVCEPYVATNDATQDPTKLATKPNQLLQVDLEKQKYSQSIFNSLEGLFGDIITHPLGIKIEAQRQKDGIVYRFRTIKKKIDEKESKKQQKKDDDEGNNDNKNKEASSKFIEKSIADKEKSPTDDDSNESEETKDGHTDKGKWRRIYKLSNQDGTELKIVILDKKEMEDLKSKPLSENSEVKSQSQTSQEYDANKSPVGEESGKSVGKEGGSESGIGGGEHSESKSKAPVESTSPKNLNLGTSVGRFLAKRICLEGGEGWWKHQLCHENRIIQYHIDQLDNSRSEIILGRWNEQSHLDWLKENPEYRPNPDPELRKEITHFYGDGMVCDENSRARFVLAKYRCGSHIHSNPTALTISFYEPKLCQYEIIIEGQDFCEPIKNTDESGLFLPFEPIN